MTRDEHKQIIQKMLGMVTPDNQATASELLAQLSDDYEETLTGYEKASTSVKELTEKNETLRDVNAKLFLKVGNTDKETHIENNNNADSQEGNENALTFEALFNEKGDLM